MAELRKENQIALFQAISTLLFAIPMLDYGKGDAFNADQLALVCANTRLHNDPRWNHTQLSGAWPACRTFKNAATGLKTLRGMDIDLDIGQVYENNLCKSWRLRFIEQNPDKRKDGNLTQPALLARAGHKIVWVIDQDESFIGKITDDAWEEILPRIFSKMKNAKNGISVYDDPREYPVLTYHADATEFEAFEDGEEPWNEEMSFSIAGIEQKI